jgi:hypothetical protein
MKITELQAEMAELEAAMSDKGIVTPEATASVKTSGFNVHMRGAYDTTPFNGNDYKVVFDASLADCIAKAFGYIAALPSPEDQVTREYLSRIAKAVDYATEHSLPDEYVTPLRNVSCAMTDNLLTHTKEPAQ